MARSSRVDGLALGAAGIALLCGMDAVAKSLGAHISTFQIVFVRFGGAAVFLSLYLLAIKGAFPQRANMGKHAMRGAMMAGTAVMYFYAATHLPLAVAMALSMTAPLYISLFGIIFLKEKYNWVLPVSIVLGLGGAAVIVFGGGGQSFASADQNMLAWVAGVLAPITYGGSLVLMKHHSTGESAAAMTIAQNVSAAVLIAPFALINPSVPELEIVPRLFLIGMLGALGYLFILSGLRKVTANAFAVLDYTGLVWAALLGYVFFAEVPEIQVWLGGALIITACALGFRFNRH